MKTAFTSKLFPVSLRSKNNSVQEAYLFAHAKTFVYYAIQNVTKILLKPKSDVLPSRDNLSGKDSICAEWMFWFLDALKAPYKKVIPQKYTFNYNFRVKVPQILRFLIFLIFKITLEAKWEITENKILCGYCDVTRESKIIFSI